MLDQIVGVIMTPVTLLPLAVILCCLTQRVYIGGHFRRKTIWDGVEAVQTLTVQGERT